MPDHTPPPSRARVARRGDEVLTHWAETDRWFDLEADSVGALKAIGLRAESEDKSQQLNLTKVVVTMSNSGAISTFK